MEAQRRSLSHGDQQSFITKSKLSCAVKDRQKLERQFFKKHEVYITHITFCLSYSYKVVREGEIGGKLQACHWGCWTSWLRWPGSYPTRRLRWNLDVLERPKLQPGNSSALWTWARNLNPLSFIFIIWKTQIALDMYDMQNYFTMKPQS